MAVPVENIYYLLCYAYGHADDLALAPRGKDLGGRTENLFAHVLLATTQRLLQRGIAKRYLEESEEIRGVRGKIQIGATLSGALLRKGLLSCRFEELSADILDNQILKSACALLSRHPGVSNQYRSRLAELCRLLGEVSDTPLHQIDFGALKSRTPRLDYSLGLAVAQLLATGALPRPEGDDRAFTRFEADPQKMGAVFEQFIRGFIEVECPGSRLLPRGAKWDARGSETDLRLLPALERDVPIVINGQRIIIECKFYEQPLATNRFGSAKIRADHLAQLFAYLTNDLPETEGLLLYAATDIPLRARFELAGRHVAVRTLNLNQSWPTVHDELLGILGTQQSGRGLESAPSVGGDH